jgi:hypothetical protein
MGFKEQLRNLKRDAERGALRIKQRAGHTVVIPRMDFLAGVYLLRLDASLGCEPEHETALLVRDALEGATDSERERIERMIAEAGGIFYDDLTPLEPGAEVEDLSTQAND